MFGEIETKGFRAGMSGSRRGLPAALAITAAALAAGGAAFCVGRAPAPRAAATWRALPDAPISGRIGEAVVWTGRDLIVAGGLARRADGTSRRVSDAAAYDPATGAWRRLAAAPDGVGSGAVWTGHALVTWTGNGPEGPAAAAAYDPSTNVWRRLPSGPLGPREGNTNVWTGEELLVIGGHSGDAVASPVGAALDPASGTWRVLHGLDGLTLAGGPSGAVWDGREAIVAGALSLCPERGSACGRSRPILVAYDPVTDRRRELRLPSAFGADPAASPTPLAWTGREVIFRAWSPRALRVLRYEPGSGAWQIGPESPCVLLHGSDTQTVWIGDRLVAPCGAGGVQAYDPQAGSWETRATRGRTPFASRSASATAWTGRRLIVWSGWAFHRFNPTPADGASLLVAG